MVKRNVTLTKKRDPKYNQDSPGKPIQSVPAKRAMRVTYLIEEVLNLELPKMKTSQKQLNRQSTCMKL